MSPPKSKMWKWFIKSAEGGICRICTQTVKTAGNTSNLRSHLKRSHPDIFNTQLQKENTPPGDEVASKRRKNNTSQHSQEHTDTDDELEIVDDPDSQTTRTSSTLSTTSMYSEASTSSFVAIKTKQPRIDVAFQKQKSFMDGGSKASDITNKLLYMIAKDNLPLSTVEKEGFQKFMQTVSRLYKIPCRTTITTLMEGKYEFLSDMIKTRLSEVRNLSLTTDIWTDTLNTKSFLGVTAHYVNSEQHKSVTIGVTELTERHTAENIEKWLLQIIADWRINKENIIIVISDNAANMKKAIVDGFGAEKYLACFAHTLNLVPGNIIKDDAIVKDLCKKIKTIVTYFKHSVPAADELRMKSTLKLIQNVDTRWNSTKNMLDRFIKLADIISPILLQSPLAPPMLSASELQTTKEFAELLKPFEDATHIICGEMYLTASKAIPIVHTIKNKLTSSNPDTKIGIHFKQELIKQLLKRFEHIEKVTPLAIATICDPRFKNLHFSDKVACSQAVNKITRMINATKQQSNEQNVCAELSTAKRDDFWAFHENLAADDQSKRIANRDNDAMPDDLKYYLNQPTITLNESPLKYWSMHPHSALQDIAMKYLSIIATSVPSERLFSKAGNIMTDNRSRLTGDHLQHLLFLNSLPLEDWFM
ncbi:E3 SUMO-protein ligase ZBED1-like isoform X2 [Temnothorax americanus]|uniref:E3 SUMO-protein ligase ZBED1-like isoform X2 n=1 Tax=Temnothorax americanus TaxID=1964332 RepID=UPI004068A5C4